MVTLYSDNMEFTLEEEEKKQQHSEAQTEKNMQFGADTLIYSDGNNGVINKRRY